MRAPHVFNLVRSKLRERKKRKTRSPHWRALEKSVLAERQRCEACGTKRHLQVHHRIPFHLHPELELERENLLVLCMDVQECHLRIGHGDNWRAYNPHAMSSVVNFRSADSQAAREAIWLLARFDRKAA